MMLYALIHYPAVDIVSINQLRRKYDPQVDLIEPHITIVFPVPGSVGEPRLVSHMEQVLRAWKPFPIHLQGLQQSWDNYLFLLIQEGKTDVIRLHDELYTGILAAYRREVVPFVPHVTLGAFPEDEDRCLQALEEAEGLKLDYQSIVDRLHLVKIHSNRSQIIRSQEFLL
jgi:2'-5' RNA ligase